LLIRVRGLSDMIGCDVRCCLRAIRRLRLLRLRLRLLGLRLRLRLRLRLLGLRLRLRLRLRLLWLRLWLRRSRLRLRLRLWLWLWLWLLCRARLRLRLHRRPRAWWRLRCCGSSLLLTTRCGHCRVLRVVQMSISRLVSRVSRADRLRVGVDP
jgi:hypothetical protein